MTALAPQRCVLCEAGVVLFDDGDGFVACACGNRHWGVHGAAGLLLVDPDRGVLLQRRARWVHHGGKWALPGGAIRSTESASEAAIREAGEEAAVPSGALRLTSAVLADHGTWSYTTIVARAHTRVRERAISSESARLSWMFPGQVEQLPLHRDFAAAWPRLHSQLDRRVVLVVDCAAMVRAQPHGWWPDSARTTSQLHDEVAALARTGCRGSELGPTIGGYWWWPRIKLVAERLPFDTASSAEVEILAPQRDGDDRVVEAAAQARAAHERDHVLVVTADNKSRAQARAYGVGSLEPAVLWRLLDGAG